MCVRERLQVRALVPGRACVGACGCVHRRTGRGQGGQLTPQFGQISYDIYSGKRQNICS